MFDKIKCITEKVFTTMGNQASRLGKDVVQSDLVKDAAAGATIGAVVAVPVPIIGPIIGATVGAGLGVYKNLMKPDQAPQIVLPTVRTDLRWVKL